MVNSFVSKHVQRPVEAGLVVRRPIPGNRKEVEMALGLHDFLQAYSNADLQVLATVLRDLLAAGRVGVRMTR